MGWRFSGHRFVSVGLMLVAAHASAADFGRFGYRNVPDVPGWELGNDGIKPRFQGAEKLFFASSASRWLVRSLQAHEADYTLIGGGTGPTRVRANLYAPGPEILFERGFSLKVRSLSPPFLSWSEGSVGNDVETPAVRWVALSYQEAQPPILLTFLDQNAAVKVTGRPGDWSLETVGTPYRRWVRFSLPLGVRALTTTDAAALGGMVAATRQHEAFWTGPSPVLKEVVAVDDGDAVIGEWRFSDGYPVVPYAAFLARRGGYDVQIQTPIREIAAPTDEGPVAYVPDKVLRIRFPVLKLPRGRSITAGSPNWRAPMVDPKRPFSILNAGLSALIASRQADHPVRLERALADYLAGIEFSQEPVSKARMPFSPDGKGAGEAAFYSVLHQGVLSGEGLNSRTNPLYTSLGWARDAMSWKISSIEDARIRRRTGGVAALAGALNGDPQARLDGALFHAGLAAEWGLHHWLGREGSPKLMEPIDALRGRLFKAIVLPAREPILPMLVNPVRLLIGPRMFANNTPTGYRLRWTAPRIGRQRIVFVSPQDCTFTPVHNSRIDPVVMTEPDRYELSIDVPNAGEVIMDVLVSGSPIKLPPTPEIIYTEITR